EDLLAPILSQSSGQHAGENVRLLSRGQRQDVADRSARESLRSRFHGDQGSEDEAHANGKTSDHASPLPQTDRARDLGEVFDLLVDELLELLGSGSGRRLDADGRE